MTDKRNQLLAAAAEHHSDFDKKHAVFTGDARVRRAVAQLLEQDGITLPKNEPICWYGSQLFVKLDRSLYRFDMTTDAFSLAYRGEP